MKTFSEARGDTAVFTFGRFNPPTTGHEKLIDALGKQQSKNAGSLMYVYPSHSQDAKKNPLPHARKVAYMKKMFRKYAKNIISSKARNVFDIAVELHNKGHRAIVMVVGSDRVQEFDRLLNQYNGVEGRHGYYGFDDIRVVSAGERDPDAEGVEGMSASKMRAAAAQGDYDSFIMGLPRNFGDAKKLYDDVRKNMGVREQNWTDEEIMRDAYIRGEVWNVGDVVETKLGEEGTIIRKGTNYVVFENMQRVWLHDLVEEPKKITKTKQAKGDVADVKGTQPAKYYSKDAEGDGMSKSTKIARARHFAKGGSRDNAPGDKGAKTKPSQYTKKFKQMYGERAKQAVSQGKVQKLVTAHGLKYDGKVYKEIDMELKGIDNNTQMVTFNIIHPKEIFGKEVKIAFKALRRGPFMATDTSKINEQDKEKKPAQSDQEKERDEFKKLQKDKKVAALQYRMAKDAETVARLSAMERKLTDAEKDKMKKLEKEIPMKKFKDLYGKEGESVYYATLTKMAKNESYDVNEEKTTYLRRDRKLPNLKVPVKRRSDNNTLAKKIRGDKVKKYGIIKNEIKEQMEAEDSLKNWKHDDAKSFAEGLIKKYGKPDEVTKTMVKWYKLQPGGGVFGSDARETYVVDESIPHSFPDPHRDFCYTVMEIKVPSDMLDTLGHVTGSIVYDGLKETVTARCGSLEANALTLQFVKDLVSGKIENDNDVAKKTYADRIRNGPFPKSFNPKKENFHVCGHNELAESLWANIHKKRQRIKQGSGEKMRKKGDKGAPTPAQLKRAKGESYEIGKDYADHTKKIDPYSAPQEDFQIDEKIEGLVNKSKQTGVPYGILKKSYDRGMAAWKGGHRPGASQQQWAFARVNSMLTGGKADPDLQAQIKKGGYKKKKKASKESVDEWFYSDETIQLYQERYGSEWEEKLNNTYKRMLSKLDESCCEDCENHFNHIIEAAEYQGKKVKLNDPIRTSENPNKKFKVYVKNEKGKVVVVRFGDPNMGINRDDPEKRKAFRARHNCDDPGPKWKARYWSCFQWRAGAKVDN